MLKIIIIDRDPLVHQAMGANLPSPSKIVSSTLGTEALTQIHKINPQILFLGSNIEEVDPLVLLEQIHAYDPCLPIIFMHNHPDYHLAAEVMRRGAHDFIHKPCDFINLPNIVKTYIKKYLSQTADSFSSFPQLNSIIGKSKASTRIKHDILQVAPSDVSVLILGENGTGKDLVAQAIHNLSPRHKSPYIPINCSAFPYTLFESELFGSRRGAFTGSTDRAGFFERAGAGTLFLDEIAEIPCSSQTKLLRVVENMSLTPIGSTQNIPIHCRIISATNQSIAERVNKGRFKIDLLFRINTVVIEVPPLRKRKEEIPDFVNHFLLKQKSPYDGKRMSLNALEKLSSHNWPGNIRELKNVIDRAAVKCPGTIIRPQHIGYFKGLI